MVTSPWSLYFLCFEIFCYFCSYILMIVLFLLLLLLSSSSYCFKTWMWETKWTFHTVSRSSFCAKENWKRDWNLQSILTECNDINVFFLCIALLGKKMKEILMYQRKIMVSWIFHTLFSQAGIFTFSWTLLKDVM